MIISASVVNAPRRARKCAMCDKMISGAQVRLFGCGEQGDPPYAIRIHPECATEDALVKLGNASQETNRVV